VEPPVGIEPTTFSLRGRLSGLHTPSTSVFADTAARTTRRSHHGFPGFRTTCGTARAAISSSSGKSALAGPSRFAGFLEPPLGLGFGGRLNTSELSEDRRRPAGHGRPHDRLDQLTPLRTAAAQPRRSPRARGGAPLGPATEGLTARPGQPARPQLARRSGCRGRITV
jgi:hypothetical protein